MDQNENKNPLSRSYTIFLSVFAAGLICAVIFLISKLAGGMDAFLYVLASIMLICFVLAMFFARQASKEGKKYIEYIYVLSVAGIVLAGWQFISFIPFQSQK